MVPCESPLGFSSGIREQSSGWASKNLENHVLGLLGFTNMSILQPGEKGWTIRGGPIIWGNHAGATLRGWTPRQVHSLLCSPGADFPSLYIRWVNKGTRISDNLSKQVRLTKRIRKWNAFICEPSNIISIRARHLSVLLYNNDLGGRSSLIKRWEIVDLGGLFLLHLIFFSDTLECIQITENMLQITVCIEDWILKFISL